MEKGGMKVMQKRETKRRCAPTTLENSHNVAMHIHVLSIHMHTHTRTRTSDGNKESPEVDDAAKPAVHPLVLVLYIYREGKKRSA